MPKPVPARIRWAVETLCVEPTDRILEIGCGPGHAVSLICPKLDSGTITAIDRSPIQVDLATRNNAGSIAAGKAIFHAVALASAALEGARFDKIFAINVNVFWIDPMRELAVVRRLLAPGAALYLFYEPPGPERKRETMERLTRTLARNGFAITRIIEAEDASKPVFCVLTAPGSQTTR